MVERVAFYSDDAEQYGVGPAIILNHFRKLMGHEIDLTHAGLDTDVDDEEIWTRSRLSEIADQFPFWTEHQIRGYLVKLIKAGALVAGTRNEDKMDRTLWYAIPGFLRTHRENIS